MDLYMHTESVKNINKMNLDEITSLLFDKKDNIYIISFDNNKVPVIKNNGIIYFWAKIKNENIDMYGCPVPVSVVTYDYNKVCTIDDGFIDINDKFKDISLVEEYVSIDIDKLTKKSEYRTLNIEL